MVTAAPASPLMSTMRLMVRENIGCTVVTEADRIEGILTERDVLTWAARDPEALPSLDTAEVMTRTVLVAELNDPVPWVLETMVRRRIRHLPVVENGALAGMVSQGDVVNAFLEHMEAENQHLRQYVKLFLEGTRRWPRLPLAWGGKAAARSPDRPAEATAGDILLSKGGDVVSVPLATSMASAMRTMADHDIGSVLVAIGQRWHGIVTERDVLRAAANDPQGFHRRSVQELMSQRLVVGAPDHGLSALMEVMTRNRIRHLPILRRGALEGIVSMRDLIAALHLAAEAENRNLRDRIQGRSGEDR